MLNKYREEITKIDEQILNLFEKRFELVEKVGEYKKQNNLPVRNIERENILIENAIKKSGLNKNFIEKLYNLIFDNSYKIEK